MVGGELLVVVVGGILRKLVTRKGSANSCKLNKELLLFRKMLLYMYATSDWMPVQHVEYSTKESPKERA